MANFHEFSQIEFVLIRLPRRARARRVKFASKSFWDLRRSHGVAEFSATVLSVAPAGFGFLVALTRS